MCGKNKFCAYVISSYTTTTTDGKAKTLWRVSRIGSQASQAKRILRKGFASEEEATTYAEELYRKRCNS
jgi:hypothetical protein